MADTGAFPPATPAMKVSPRLRPSRQASGIAATAHLGIIRGQTFTPSCRGCDGSAALFSAVSNT
ncbi:hypothetical protein I553_0457 [Mycobacterium xenopi 4042]|uniref:Uncharacterized protein n=1 Tax=Mycobacterium xenopi 4042 TaxID=1299334 RepID=X7YHJ2_MYCXE|nr:hypothetical protein I553_0457 [Mycobacterium xenopi 4042]